MPFVIDIQGLTKRYQSKITAGSKLALNSVDLKVKEGIIFGFLGPNGAGKSTLINILAGTVTKTSGTVKICDVNIDTQSKLAKSKIGIVPQEIVLDTFFPLAQQLEMRAGYYGIRPQDRKTDEILTALGLYDKRNDLPRALSGGMKRRFLIAKAMVHSPKILILDEPTAGVDIELREQLWDYVHLLNSQGTTIIITTHYLAEAQELCEEIAFINHGNIIMQEEKTKLLQSLGSRNVIVEFTEPISNRAALDKLGNYEIKSDNIASFSVNENQDFFNELIQAIESDRLKIKNISTTEPDLEEVFRKVISSKG